MLRLLLLIDNYDSFTYNLLHALHAFEREIVVFRNDTITPEEIERRDPEVLVVSPGPGTPERSGVSVEAIRASLGRRPILGVCLGHQALGVAVGGKLRRAKTLVHGKARPIEHRGDGIFVNLQNPLSVARYHSLVLDEASVPAELLITARSDDGDIMAVSHARHCAVGLQFHPESFLTLDGRAILANFFDIARGAAAKH